MCTLNISFEPEENYPLLVVANRDELFDRPSTPPAIIHLSRLTGNTPVESGTKTTAIFAPRDLEAGGTWFGINEWGLVAAITNVWLRPLGEELNRPLKSSRSRGLLTLDALSCENIGEVRELISRKIAEDIYQFFNLLVASSTEAIVFTYDGRLREHVLKTRSATIGNAPFMPKEADQMELSPFPSGEQAGGERIAKWLGEIRRFLSQHPDICKHGEKYGTRSSQVAALGKHSADYTQQSFPDRFWYTDGPPCLTEFDDYSSQLQTVTIQLSPSSETR